MKPLAVRRTDPLTGRIVSLDRDRVRVRPLGRAADGGKCDPVSQGFAEYDAKDVNGGPHHDRPANLKPNIYYKAQEFTLGAKWVPGRRDASRADGHLSGTAGAESGSVGPGVEVRLGPTEAWRAPDGIVRAGFSFDQPVAFMVGDAACDC
jgi:hypothetical protein